MPAQPPANLSRNLKLLVVFVLYFAEGVPFGFVYTTLAYYLRSRGVPLEQIGILSLLGLAWSLKVLWSPLADRFGTRAAWLVRRKVHEQPVGLCLGGRTIAPATGRSADAADGRLA